MNPVHPLTARRIAAIKAAIASKRLDYKQIAATTFTSEPYTLRVMSILHAAGQVHVAAWKLCERTYAALYAWGPGPDAPRPTPITSTEGQRQYRARIRKDPEANEFYLAKMRAKDRASRAAKRPSTWLSALGV